jgi:hypothetical protein
MHRLSFRKEGNLKILMGKSLTALRHQSHGVRRSAPEYRRFGRRNRREETVRWLFGRQSRDSGPASTARRPRRRRGPAKKPLGVSYALRAMCEKQRNAIRMPWRWDDSIKTWLDYNTVSSWLLEGGQRFVGGAKSFLPVTSLTRNMLSSASFSLLLLALAPVGPALAVPALGTGAQLADLADWTVGTISRAGSDGGVVHANTVWEFIDCGELHLL